MSNYAVDSNVRVVLSEGALDRDVRDKLINLRASPSKDLITWTIDVDVFEGDPIEESIKRSLELISSAKANSWWLPRWQVAAWFTISSKGEFAGISVPNEVCKRAGELDVDLVFSVYCHQSD